MLRNKFIPRKHPPARSQLLRGINLHVLGDGQLPQGDRKSKASCDKLLPPVWNAKELPPVWNAKELDLLAKRLIVLIDATVEE